MTIDKNFLSDTLNCNCNKKEECPLPCVCLTSAIVYQAEVKTSEETTTYIGITGGTFKQIIIIIIIIINFIPSQVCFFILIHCVLNNTHKDGKDQAEAQWLYESCPFIWIYNT